MNPVFPPLQPGITVSIPTYNRPGDLARTLNIIVPQVLADSRTYLHVHDNCTPQDIPCLNDEILRNHDRIKISRNRYNEGFANIIRCFVECETEWIWVLGDDDLPSADAIDVIFAKLASDAADSCCMTFRIPHANVHTKLSSDISGHGLEAFFAAFDHRYMEMLCLSASVYNVRSIRPYIEQAYRHLFCAAPHSLMAFLAIEAGGKWLCSKDCIADYKVPDEEQHWNRFLVSAGIPTITFALKSASSRKLVRSAIQRTWSSRPYRFFALFENYYGNENKDLKKVFDYFFIYYLPKLSENPIRYVLWILTKVRLSLIGR